jgi:hypothetical protein
MFVSEELNYKEKDKTVYQGASLAALSIPITTVIKSNPRGAGHTLQKEKTTYVNRN